MTMDSAPARHTGQGGTGPAGGSAFAPAPHAAARRSATAIHPPRGPRTDQARSAVRPQRVRRRGRVLPLLTADALAAVLAVTTLPGAGLPALAAVRRLAALLAALHAQAGLYRPRLAPSALLELPALAGRSAVLWCGTAAVLAAVDPARSLGWSALLTAVCLQVVLACAGRGVVNQLRRRAAVRRPASALVVGPGAGAARGGRRPARPPRVRAAAGRAGRHPAAAERRGARRPAGARHPRGRPARGHPELRTARRVHPPAEADEPHRLPGPALPRPRLPALARRPGRHRQGHRHAGAHPADQLWGYAVQPLLPRPARPVERCGQAGHRHRPRRGRAGRRRSRDGRCARWPYGSRTGPG